MAESWTKARRPRGSYTAALAADELASRARVAAAVDSLDHWLAPTTPELAAVLDAERSPEPDPPAVT